MAVLKNVVSKIFNLSTTPAKKTEGQFWYDATNNVLKRSDGTDYKPLPVGDNLISAGSTDTIKGILDSKANYSDLTDYLPLTGGTIARYDDTCSDPILTIENTFYGDGLENSMSGLLVKGGELTWEGQVEHRSTFIRPDKITGDAVTSSITSGSDKLLTSGGAYTALQSKADNTNVVHLSGDIEDLQKLSAKTGRFFFNGGTFQATQKQALGTTFSICRTLKIKWEDWETLADYRYFDGNNLGWGSNETIGWGFAVVSHRLFFYYRPLPKSSEGAMTILSLTTAQTQAIMDGNTHTLIVIGANNTISLYVDGLLIKSQTATGEIIDIPTPSYVQTIRQITGEYSRIKQFNFDMSASDAPYTIEDYCTGIEEPPSLHNPTAEYHADYSYVNFAMTRNDSTRIVLDNSGYNNYATLSGDIIGDKDNEVLNFTSTAITAEIDSLSAQLLNKFNDKINSGVLHCNGGYAIANNVDYPETFSVAFRTDWDFVDTSKKFFPVKIGMSNTYGINFYSHAQDGRLHLFVNTATYVSQAIASYTFSSIKTHLNTGLNSFALVLAKDTDGNFLPKFYVNNNLIENLSTTKIPAFAMGSGEFKLNCYTTSSANITTGEVVYQDVCLFNFDMSEDSASYTLADYQTGKSIPPSLKSGYGERFNIQTAVENTDYQTEFIDCTGQYTLNNGVHRFEIAEQTGNYPSANFEVKFNKTIKAGSEVVVNLKRADLTKTPYEINFTPNYFTIQGNTATQGINTLRVNGSANWDNETLINNRLVLTKDCNGCYIYISMSARYFEFTDFSIEVNGAMLALEDYTINGKVLDYSGNNNHATITGNVIGDNDSRVSTFIETIANNETELNAVIMPTYNSSGVQNGKAKIKLYKDDTTGAITIEAEEIVE